jgi:hypothetical protein
MTRKRMGLWLSTSRVKGLERFVEQSLSAWELGELMWPGHRMAKVNGRAIVRELLLGEFIEPVNAAQPAEPVNGEDPVRYRATARAAAVIENPPWLCRYCKLDTMNSMKRLWVFPCDGCGQEHQVCRFCRKHLLKAFGGFPYVIRLRGCPGSVQIPPRPEKKPKKEEIQVETQSELAT